MLPTESIAYVDVGETAAVRDFHPAQVGSGSKSGVLSERRMSAFAGSGRAAGKAVCATSANCRLMHGGACI